MNKKPNIVFLLTDDQRYNTIHALGNDEIKTPAMDYLVEHGTSFVQAHIPGGTTGAVCMPSRAMINSGRGLYHLQGEGQTIPEDHITLGETLRKAGYNCFGTGKWHNGPPAFTRSFNGGDNIFFGGMWDHWNVPTSYYDPTGEYDNVINFVANHMLSNKVQKIHCDKFNPGKHSSELLTDTAIEFIKNVDTSEKPFYLYTAYLAPHDPRTMPEEYKKMYDPAEIKLPESYRSTREFEYGMAKGRDENLASYPRKEEEVRRHIAEYYGMISHLDHEIGRLIEALREKGELDNTIIVFAGDNGLAVGCHGLMGKQSLYDHSIRIPLIISGPGLPKNQRVDQFVYLMDIYPTLCDILGCEIPSSVEGRSFYKMFSDPSFSTRDYLYLSFRELIRGVKDHRYKLVEYRTVAHRTQLFDLVDDPNELHDLSDDPKYADVKERLGKLLIEGRDESDDLTHPCGKSFWNCFENEDSRGQ